MLSGVRGVTKNLMFFSLLSNGVDFSRPARLWPMIFDAVRVPVCPRHVLRCLQSTLEDQDALDPSMIELHHHFALFFFFPVVFSEHFLQHSQCWFPIFKVEEIATPPVCSSSLQFTAATRLLWEVTSPPGIMLPLEAFSVIINDSHQCGSIHKLLNFFMLSYQK